MTRSLVAAVAAAALMAPLVAQAQTEPSQGPVQQSPATTPQTQRMQSQRDWTPEQKAERPPTHRGEQNFGAGQSPTVGQSGAQGDTVTKIPEGQLNPPPKQNQ